MPRPRSKQELRLIAQSMLVQQSFPDFLKVIRITDEHGEGGTIKFQPWPHLVEMAQKWQDGESQVVLKARQVGVSWTLAAYALWKAQYHKGATVLELSQGEDEATELLDKSRRIYQELAPHFRYPLENDRKGELSFDSGGRIFALPATEKAGRGYTASLVIADEAAFHPYARQNYAAYRPTLDGGGQLLMVSTANGATGFFHDLFWASYNETNDYKGVFLPWHVRPGRDDEWLARERSNFVGLGSFEQEFPNTPEEAFVAQSGLVYDCFNRDFHVKPSPVAWEDFKWRVGGIDFGGGDPTAVVPLGVTGSEHLHQPEEFYRTGPVTVEEIAAYLSALHNRAPFHALFADASEPVAIATLQSLGFPVYKADRRRPEGLSFVRLLLENKRLTIDPSCKYSINEFNGYRFRETLDPNSKDRYRTSTPVDHHADAMDARRYAVLGFFNAYRKYSGARRRVKVAYA